MAAAQNHSMSSVDRRTRSSKLSMSCIAMNSAVRERARSSGVGLQAISR